MSVVDRRSVAGRENLEKPIVWPMPRLADDHTDMP
jgi:hypothetical protein